MRSSFRWLIAAVIVGMVIVRAVQRHSEEKATDQAIAADRNRPLATEIVADDPAAREAVMKAIKTPLQATSCRVSDEITNLAHGYTSRKITTEIVKPDKIHVREEVDRRLKSESFTDGKRLLVRKEPDAEFKEDPQDVARKIERLAPSISDPYPEDKMQQTGHEDINGVPATIYKWESTRLVPSRKKLWVDDAGGRLLKMEGQSKGNLAFNNIPIRVDDTWTTTYEYDPSITINLPTASAPSPSASPATP